MSHFFRKISYFFSILTLLLTLSHCGSGSPPASIPAPVASFMTATSPTGNPSTTTVSGAPNTVQPNSTVTIANLTQGGTTVQLRQSFFIKSAFAFPQQPFVQVSADNQGGFPPTVILANVGDDIGVRYQNPLGDISDQQAIPVPCGGANPVCAGPITP